MHSKKKRIDSSYVSDRLWKAANKSQSHKQQIDLNNLVGGNQSKQTRFTLDRSENGGLGIVNISETTDFSFSLLKVHPPTNAPIIIREKDKLVARTIIDSSSNRQNEIIQSLNVETPITTHLYKFKKRLVPSDQIEKKIESNDYLLFLLGKKKDRESQEEFKDNTVKSRMRSAIPRNLQSNYSFNSRGYSGTSTQGLQFGDQNNCLNQQSTIKRPFSVKKSQPVNIEFSSRQPRDQNDHSTTKLGQENKDDDEKFKIKIKFNPRPTSVVQRNSTSSKGRQISAFKSSNIPNSQFCISAKQFPNRLSVQKPGVQRPSTSSNFFYHPSNLLHSNVTDRKNFISRPVSSITPMLEARRIFSSVSKVQTESFIPAEMEEMPALFDFNEHTVFVSLLFNNQTEYIRPSDRIGYFIQTSQSLKAESVAYISTLKRGTHFDSKAINQIPLQFSVLGVFEENRQPREKGICYYLSYEKMLDTACYSIFPEFVSSEIISREGVKILSSSSMEENERRFENRDAYYRHLILKMKGTYDPGVLVDDYTKKRVLEITYHGPSAILKAQSSYEASIDRFRTYCSEKFIPKNKIPPFYRDWVVRILRHFSEQMLKEKETKMREFFKTIFDSYIHSQRKSILAYLLKSEKERKRLSIQHLPSELETISNEVIARQGGYHQRLFTNWHNAVINCKRFLSVEEKLLNMKTHAFKNWLSHFQSVQLFEEQFLGKANERDVVANINGFIKFQTVFIDMFQIFGEHVIKRGITALLDGNFYLKPASFDLYGHFDMFMYWPLNSKNNSETKMNFETILNSMEDILGQAVIKDTANVLDLYSKVWRKIKPTTTAYFETPISKGSLVQVLDLNGKPCDPRQALQSFDPYNRSPETERLIPVMCLILQEFIVDRVTHGFQRFYDYLKSRIDFMHSKPKHLINQPFISLELRFEDNVFSFDDSWNDVRVSVLAYFEKLTHSFDFLFDVFNFTISIVSKENLDKRRNKKRPVSADGVKTDQETLLKDVTALYSKYLPELAIELKSKDEEDINELAIGTPKDNRSQYLNQEKIINLIREQTSELRQKVIQMMEDEYNEAIKIKREFTKFHSILSKTFENDELPEFMKSQRANVMAFTPLVMLKNKNTHAAEIVQATDKLKKEELIALKTKLTSLITQLTSIESIKYQSVFKIRCNVVSNSIMATLREIDDRMCKKVVERVIINVKAFLARYQRLTDLLRKEIATSADYAWLRSFSVEVGQEKLILLKKTKEIFENFDYYLKLRAAKVNGTEVLELLLELSNADRALGEEIENSLERGFMRKVEFERQLKEDKVMFQAECTELLDEVQILRTINDIRNSTQYCEEVEHLYEKLDRLKADFQSIDAKEFNIYERNFKTVLFVELDDLVLTNLEVWRMVSSGLSFIKKTNLLHVSQLKIEPIEEFLVDIEKQYAAIVDKEEIWSKENLKIILTDFKREVDEFASHLSTIQLICTKELRLDHWKSYFDTLTTDLDFQFLNLKIFLSLFNNENQKTFEELCGRAVAEDIIKNTLDKNIEDYKGIEVIISDKQTEEFIENYEDIMANIDNLKLQHAELESNSTTDYAKEEIAKFGRNLETLAKYLPSIKLMQRKLEFFKQVFTKVEFGIKIEKEHRSFMTVMNFNQKLKSTIVAGGVAALCDYAEFAEQVKENLSRLEIIENHPSKAILSSMLNQEEYEDE